VRNDGTDAGSAVASERAVGQRLRELRTGTGMSQQALAAAMVRRGWPWHQSTVHRIESGSQALRVGELVDVALVFGVSPGKMLGEADSRAMVDERREMERTLRRQIAAEIAGRPEAAA
jgi:transcriptional regulator with XRE-family HTH domain